MTERIADPKAICPFVALDDDRDYRAPGPDHRHRCFAENPAAPRALAHQAAYCLSISFPGCPAFMDWARREAAPARVESAPRSVREAGTTRAAAVPPAGRPTSRAGGSGGDWTAPPPWGAAAGAVAGFGADAAGAPAADAAGSAAGGLGADAGGLGADAQDGPNEIDDTLDAQPDEVGVEPAEVAPLPDMGGARQAPDAGDTPAFLAGRHARPVPTPPWDDEEPRSEAEVADLDSRFGEPSRIPVVTPRRMPVGYAPVAPGKGEHRGSGSGRDRPDLAAPSWEQPRRFEEYPTLKSRGGAGIPRPVIYALVILLVGVGLFAAPFILKGLGGGGQASPTPGPSGSAAPTAEASPTAVPTPGQIVYTVKSGETLSQIAARYGVTIDQIIAANPKIKNPNKIAAGDKIVIPQPLPSEIVDPGITPVP